MSLRKIAVITGTSSGVGEALAHSLLANGWKVYGIARSPKAKLLSPYPHYTHIQCDISNANKVYKKLDLLRGVTVDLLINNAAVFEMLPFADTFTMKINELIDTNVKGAMFVTHRLLWNFSVGGRIIFINSVAGLEELENQAVYCASKHALTAFAGVLGKELRIRRIKVTSIHPGGINTPLWNESNRYPIGNVRNALDVAEIIRAVDFVVASPENVEYKTIKLFPSVEWH